MLKRINHKEALPRFPTRFPRRVKDLGENMMPRIKPIDTSMPELYPRRGRAANQ
jgi:hypothetical protein